jgi:outer membrane receptor protein involved in Fe transport
VELPGHTVVNLALRWTHRFVAVTLAADNVTDRRYESFVGFTAPGRRFRLSLELAL